MSIEPIVFSNKWEGKILNGCSMVAILAGILVFFDHMEFNVLEAFYCAMLFFAMAFISYLARIYRTIEVTLTESTLTIRRLHMNFQRVIPLNEIEEAFKGDLSMAITFTLKSRKSLRLPYSIRLVSGTLNPALLESTNPNEDVREREKFLKEIQVRMERLKNAIQ